MDKIINIVNYRQMRTPIVIENFESVLSIGVKIISGDEILTVLYNDGTTKEFDSASDRWMGLYDDDYIVPLDKLDAWSNKEGSSYDRSLSVK